MLANVSAWSRKALKTCKCQKLRKRFFLFLQSNLRKRPLLFILADSLFVDSTKFKPLYNGKITSLQRPVISGFVPVFEQKIQGLFKDFQGLYSIQKEP